MIAPTDPVCVATLVTKQQSQVDINEDKRIGDCNDIFQDKKGIGILTKANEA